MVTFIAISKTIFINTIFEINKKNSFSFEILNVDFPGADKDGSFESFFTSRVDYAYIYIRFKNN